MRVSRNLSDRDLRKCELETGRAERVGRKNYRDRVCRYGVNGRDYSNQASHEYLNETAKENASLMRPS